MLGGASSACDSEPQLEQHADTQPVADSVPTIRRLLAEDAERLFAPRRESLVEEPFAFLSSPEDDAASSAKVVRQQLTQSNVRAPIFGAFLGEQLVGMVGLSQDRPVKAAHRACIWGVYVAPAFRHRGIAKQLLHAAVACAREMPGVLTVYLSVSERHPEAKRLYESLGFVVWGLEPDRIRVAGEPAREYHLSLSL